MHLQVFFNVFFQKGPLTVFDTDLIIQILILILLDTCYATGFGRQSQTNHRIFIWTALWLRIQHLLILSSAGIGNFKSHFALNFCIYLIKKKKSKQRDKMSRPCSKLQHGRFYIWYHFRVEMSIFKWAKNNFYLFLFTLIFGNSKKLHYSFLYLIFSLELSKEISF